MLEYEQLYLQVCRQMFGAVQRLKELWWIVHRIIFALLPYDYCTHTLYIQTVWIIRMICNMSDHI